MEDGRTPGPLGNDASSELMLIAAAEEEGHRRRALERAAKEAWRWDDEASAVVSSGRTIAAIAGIPREQILNYRTVAEVAAWTARDRRSLSEDQRLGVRLCGADIGQG